MQPPQFNLQRSKLHPDTSQYVSVSLSCTISVSILQMMVVMLFGQVEGPKQVLRSTLSCDAVGWVVAIIFASHASDLGIPNSRSGAGAGVSSHSCSSNSCHDWRAGKAISPCCAKPRIGFTFWSDLPWSSAFYFWWSPVFSFEHPWVLKGEPGKGWWPGGRPEVTFIDG